MEFFDKYLGEFITALIGLFGILTTNFVNKREMNAKIKSSELDNLDKSVDVYKKLIDDLESRFQKMHDSNAKEIEELKKKLEDVEAYWKKKYDDLKKQFESYKKEHP